MKKLLGTLLLAIGFASCGNRSNLPDVSNISVNVEIERFDQTCFRLDTNRIAAELTQLNELHSSFYADFMEQILGLPAHDTTADVKNNLRFFLKSYAPLYDSLRRSYTDVADIKAAVEEGLRYVKYYFPEYNSVKKLIFFVGPFDAPGTALTRSGIAVGLQQYAGKDFSFYQSPQGLEIFPAYISRRFERTYIPINALKLVVQELCPDSIGFGPLIDQLVVHGREAWLLDQFLPTAADSLKLGFTQQQADWCEKNEALIWSYLVKNVDLQSTDPNLIQNFLGEAPFTAGLDQEHSPGNLGRWIGRQIVRAYLQKNPSATPIQVVKLTPAQIIEGAAYKPN
jgi:hypothetical protein